MSTLASLEPLVGEWAIEGSWPADPPIAIRGRATFEWLPGRRFLVQRWTIEPAEFPDGIAIIGADASGMRQRYFDSRGVHRVYEMSLENDTWTLSRHGDDFSQRYRAEISGDHARITGRWEKSDDGVTWEHDFDLGYTRTDLTPSPRR